MALPATFGSAQLEGMSGTCLAESRSVEDRYFHLIDAEDRARTALRDYQTAADVVYNDQVRDAVQVIRDAAGVLGSLGNVSDSPTAVLKAVGDIFNRYAAELERLHSVSPRDIHLRELAARADALESAVRLCAHERDEFTEALDALWECAAHRRAARPPSWRLLPSASH